MGSTFAARLAGTQQATNATTVNNPAMPINVRGSVALIPNSKFFMVRVNTIDATTPNATPNNASFIPYPANQGSTNSH